MKDRRKSERTPIDDFLRYQDMELRRERRMLRAMLARVEGVERTREELLAELLSSKKLDEEEIRERLLFIGFTGDGYALDELLRMANPKGETEPDALDLTANAMLRDPSIREGFFVALGYLGQHLYERDADRIRGLMVLIRRGLRDEYPEVRIAAALALRGSVKYHRVALEAIEEAIPLLMELLTDPSWQVRRAAILALTEIPDPRALRALKNHALREKDSHLVVMAEQGVKRVRDRASYFRYVGRPLQSIRDLLPKSKSRSKGAKT